MPARARLTVLLFSISATVTAQTFKSYFGPTLGISTPDFGRAPQTFLIDGRLPVTERVTPIPSPVVGLAAGITVGKHLALDAGLQYSYTGRRLSQEFPQSGDFLKARTWIHKAALPLTVGYASNLGRTHLRFGVGGTFQYFAAARAALHFTAPINNVRTEVRARINLYQAPLPITTRMQALPRVSLSVAPSERLMIGAAYSHGRKMAFGFSPALARRESAIDLTATYLIRKLSVRRGAQSEGAEQ